MFRLAHISDVHLAPLPPVKFRQLLSKRITGFINWKLNRGRSIGPDYLGPLLEELQAAKPDHIAITGDLVNLSLPLEFLRARDFLNELGTPENVSAVCGNHDAYVPGALRSAIRAWQPYLCGDDTVTERKRDFPYLRIRNDVALIGCNSADATAPFYATGYFRRRQADALGKLLDRTKDLCRIVMIHHSPVEGATPPHKRLIGMHRFNETIAEHGAELVLHGHTHLATRNELQGPGRKVPVICVPATGNGTGNLMPPGRYNLFDIERAASQWRIRWTAFGHATASSGFGRLVDEEL